MFPRQLLCRHFWTEQQRVEFASQDLKRCLPHYPQILSFLRFHSAFIYDPGLQRVFLQSVLSPVSSFMHHPIQLHCAFLTQINRGKQPEVKAILEVKQAFIASPYGLEHLWKGWRQRLHMVL
jgi:hypothetical protein